MSNHVTIVDNDDNPISSKHWKEMRYSDLYRSSALWLTDIQSGDILLAQRARTKQNDPGKWGAAVAGTIEIDETYEANIVKEIEEEIGLINLSLAMGPKAFIDHGSHQFFCQWFLASVDKNKVQLQLQQDEVETTKWIPKKWLIDDVRRNPGNYVPSMAESLKVLEIVG